MLAMRFKGRIMLVASTAIIAVASGYAAARLTVSAASSPSGSSAASHAPDSADSEMRPLHPILIPRPSGPPRTATGMFDELGREVSVSCASCHANFTANLTARSGDDLREFHVGLHTDHGGLSCVTCHHPENYNLLRLADGTKLPFDDVMTLCGQCHAPQARDYAIGAHGGMSGYWDLSRGPQVRKNCIDCHDPHAPAFPHMIPTFRPHDRFLGGGHE